MNAAAASSPNALDGVRVLEICTTIAGPACGRLLADFGADVIKIEPPDGDPVRQLGNHVGDVALYAASILRGKRSMVIDLKNSEGVALALALIAQVDVVLENNRPGVLERMGLGYEAAKKIKPDIVYARISGYGQDGPSSQLPGYGAICEAFGGVRHLTGDPDRPPSRVALATTDYLSSVYAAFGILAALRHRDRTGFGQVVDVALYEAAFSQMESVVPAYDKLGNIPIRQGPNLPSMAPNSLYPTREGGYVLIAANSRSTYERLIQVMDRPDLLTDPRYATIRSRGLKANMQSLDAMVADWTRGFDGPVIEKLLQDAGVPASRVFTIQDIFDDPHYAARDMIARVPHPVLGEVRQTGVVPKLSATPGRIRHTGPELGADTESVLRDDLALAPDVIAALVDAGVVRTTSTVESL
ncbi:CaiB/BaiF CoA transferase family protein [Variovorax sp. PBL-E5]|uniref:CaiB/BaiF CoA transferase family protein n=1 Tax=Variovorax sp. PBL-E5 TaxID=434014 RepID=UPI0013170E5F|nr:CoA transferase [Variovorax sp. PBL-E5]VTU45534.1 Succinyl-CoA:(R)-benzylsuccinate CoA-transferase subunit BbsF [Variovorax sp. PBL-E5]